MVETTSVVDVREGDEDPTTEEVSRVAVEGGAMEVMKSAPVDIMRVA